MSCPILIAAGNYIGEGQQFEPGGGSISVQIGRVCFATTVDDTIDVAQYAFDRVTGAFVGGTGAILSLRVTTASSQATTSDRLRDGLDLEPDASTQGAELVYVSEAPGIGVSGAYAGLNIENLRRSAADSES